MTAKQFGSLAQRFSNLTLELVVLKSANGYYIGTFDSRKGPVSRESFEYWPTYDLAIAALYTQQWTQRSNP